MLAGVLILLALVAGVIIFLITARGYCQCRTWSDWSNGDQCPEGCSAAYAPSAWNQDDLLYCRKQFQTYGSTDVYDLPAAAVHERYFVYQTPNVQDVHFFLAVQTSGYASDAAHSPNVAIDVTRSELTTPSEPIPIYCNGPQLISEAPTDSTAYGTPSIWGWYCRVAGAQQGFPGEYPNASSTSYPGPSGATYPGASNDPPPSYPGFLGYRVYVKNISAEPLRYCYVAVCDRRYPKGDRCPDPAVSLQTAPPRPGEPSIAPPYPQSDPTQPYPSQPYPSQPYPTQPYPSQPYPTEPYPTQPPPSSADSPSPATPPPSGGTE